MLHIHTSHANMAINPNDFTESVRVTVLHLERIHARSEICPDGTASIPCKSKVLRQRVYLFEWKTA